MSSYEENDEFMGGIMDMSTADQVGIAAFFASSVPLAAFSEMVLHAGFTGLAVGAVGGGVLALAGRQLMKNGALSRVSIVEQIRHADWSLLLRSVGELEEVRQLPASSATLETTRREIVEMQQGPNAASLSSEEGYLRLGDTLQPHANTMFSNRVAILGMPNAGKSNTVAVIMEEIAQPGGPCIIFDHKPEYGRLCARPYFINPYPANAHNVTPANAFQFAQRMMNERLQVVLDLRSYKDDNAAAQVMIDIIEGVWVWEESLDNDDRIPCTFVLDEAHYWLPEAENMSTVSRVKDKETGISLFTQLQRAFFNLVNGGRSLGMGIVVSTQRPANIDKRAIAVSEWKILLKANMPNDLKVYRDFGVSDEVAMNLERGQAYIVGPGTIKGVFQLRKRHSPDDSKTPGLAALRKQSTGQHMVSRQASVPTIVYDQVNDKRADKHPVYPTVNAPVEPSNETTAEVFTDVFINGTSRAQTSERAPVNDDIRKHIRRMNEMGFAHRDISKVVGLYGPKYHLYKQVCAEEGITVERES